MLKLAKDLQLKKIRSRYITQEHNTKLEKQKTIFMQSLP